MSTWRFVTQTVPSNPSAGQVRLYIDSADSSLKTVDSAGTVRLATVNWAAVPQTVLPASDNAYDLGSSANAWRDVFVDGDIRMGAAAAQLVGGATSFAIRNAADNSDNVLVSDAGSVTIRTNLVVDTTTLVVDASANRVGFGTAAPSELVHLSGNAVAMRVEDTNIAGNVALVQASTTAGPVLVGHTDSGGLSTRNAAAMLLQVGSTGLVVSSSPATVAGVSRAFTTRATLDPTSGHLGIGTASPGGRLHVYDTDAGYAIVRFSGLTSGTTTLLAAGTVTDALYGVCGGATDGTSRYSIENIAADYLTLGTATTTFGNNLQIAVTAGGAITIARYAGSGTWAGVLRLMYR